MSASRRSAVSMDADEVAVFLAVHSRMVVGTFGPDGWPHLVAVDYAVVDGAPVFVSYDRAQKVVNLRRDSRLTALVETGGAYHELRGVALEGTARLVDDFATVLDLSRRVAARATGCETLPAFLDGELERITTRRVAVFLEVARTRSWDHSRLGNAW